MDKFLIHPSFTGDSDDIVFKATHRRQWDNMPNGPVTTLASAHANIVDRLGIGMYFMNDHNDNTKTNSFNIYDSYHITIGNKKIRLDGQLSFVTSMSLAVIHFTGITVLTNDTVY